MKKYDFMYAERSGWHTLWRKEQRCPTEKGKILRESFWFRYYLHLELLGVIHITNTQKRASGSDPTLLFGRRTERRYVYKLYELLVSRFYLHTVVGRVVNCTGVIYGARTHSARRYKCDFNGQQLYRCMHAIRNGDSFFRVR